MVEIITRQQQANSAESRWRTQYHDTGSEYRHGKDKGIIHRNLIDLGPQPTPEDVNNTIGNNSWTDLHCCECSTSGHEKVIQVGEEPEYEGNTATLCMGCLTKAVAMAQGG